MGKFILGFLGLLLIFLLGSFVFEKIYYYPSKVSFGVTFSPKYARYLKLDWKKTYIEVLDGLKVKNLRIPGYWDILEPNEGRYDFAETDYMLSEADKRSAKVVLVLGVKQPRWPECHIPAWAKSLGAKERQKKILQFIQKTVEKYQNHPAIWAWQVENEPLLPFFGAGCDGTDANFLKSEVSLVRSISQKKVLVSDSGELGAWIVPMQLSDIFGTTLYREVSNPIMGYFTYPTLPYLYNLKAQIAKIFAPANQKTVVIELQAEPWFADGDPLTNIPQQAKRFPVQRMESYINYAKKTGFDEMYLWGVEWWYLMAEKGYPEYLEYTKTLFR